MRILVLKKCRVNGVRANVGDVLDVPEAEAIELEAHGEALFDPEAEAEKEANDRKLGS